jgi:hypothetical protein
LFILFNLPVYWISGAPKIRYIYMFIPFAMNVFVFLHDKFEQQHPGSLNRYLKYGALLFIAFLAGIVILPFFEEVNIGWTISFILLTILFLFLYLKFARQRLWLFIAGIILMRLFYGAVVIPLRAEQSFDYKPGMKALSSMAGGEEVNYWHPTDTLRLGINIGKTLYKWKGENIVIPAFVLHQVPYYYYVYSGKIMKLDTVMREGPQFISYSNNLTLRKIERIYGMFDGKAKDSLILFRYRKE